MKSAERSTVDMRVKLTYALDRDIRVDQAGVRETAVARLFVKKMELGICMVLLALANEDVQLSTTLCSHESQHTFLG